MNVIKVSKENYNTSRFILFMLLSLIFLVFLFLSSISIGLSDINFKTVIQSLLNFDYKNQNHQIIQELRLPRVIASCFAGLAFATSGAIMQGITRNPMASPDLLGVNSGAVFTVSIVLSLFTYWPFQYRIYLAFLGSGISVLTVYGVASISKSGLTPVRVTLAGAAVSAFLISLSSSIAIHFKVAQNLAFWTSGSLSGAKWSEVKLLIPWVVFGFLLSIWISKSITLLTLGDEIAIGLGQKTNQVKIIGATAVLILAGVSVATVGPIGFIGLVTPHFARMLVGVDYRFTIPLSGILGAILLVLSDIVARIINPPFEVPVGAITTLIGVPFFLYLARKEGRKM